MKRIIISIFSAALLAGCSADYLGMIAPPSDTVKQRFEQSMEWNGLHGYKELTVSENEYRFHIGTDIHTDGSVVNITKMVTDMRNDEKSHFALLLGDLTHGKGNFPVLMEALEFNPDTQAQNDTVFATVGNHDLYFGQWEDYRKYWGTATYRFTVKTPDHTDLFICLDTGSGTLGKRQLDWLKETLESEAAGKRHIIVFTHTELFRTDNSAFPSSSMPMEETFDLTSLMQEYGVKLYLQGHNHYRHDIRYRDVRYIVLETMKDEAEDPYFMVADVSDGIRCTFVPIV